jgi:hypothetical protein
MSMISFSVFVNCLKTLKIFFKSKFVTIYYPMNQSGVSTDFSDPILR